jgi:hypothetical protein
MTDTLPHLASFRKTPSAVPPFESSFRKIRRFFAYSVADWLRSVKRPPTEPTRAEVRFAKCAVSSPIPLRAGLKRHRGRSIVAIKIAAAAFQAVACVRLNSLKAKKLQISTDPVQHS